MLGSRYHWGYAAAGPLEGFVPQIENRLVRPAIMALDEYGIPIQVGQGRQALRNKNEDLDLTLARPRALDVTSVVLTPLEESFVHAMIDQG